MTTLDADQLADIREITSADNATEYSDTKIQAQYDLAVVDAPDSGMVLPFTYVYVLRRLWGKRSILVDRLTDHGNRETFSQKRDATKTLLDYWERYTGLTQGTFGVMQTGSMLLDLDYTEDDFEAEFEDVSDG